jgi:hypothetical protein
MPAPDEYRHMAELALKLASEATEPYAKEALLELAGYGITARRSAQAERRSASG